MCYSVHTAYSGGEMLQIEIEQGGVSSHTL